MKHASLFCVADNGLQQQHPGAALNFHDFFDIVIDASISNCLRNDSSDESTSPPKKVRPAVPENREFQKWKLSFFLSKTYIVDEF